MAEQKIGDEGIESITQETLDFLRKTIERVCNVLNLRIFPPWNGRRISICDVMRVRITKERCGMEYPGLGRGKEHFLSGLTLSISENGDERHVFLRFSPHHEPPHPYPSVIDLTACQRLLCEKPSAFEQLFSFQIRNSIAVAIREDEKGLRQHRQSPSSDHWEPLFR